MEEEKKQITSQVVELSQYKIKSLICQLQSETYQIKENISRVEKSLVQYTDQDEIDLVLFPEMAFSGYTFKNLDDIQPCLEQAGQGPVFQFCSKLAQKLKSYVACGYAQIEIKKIDDKNQPHYFNSAYLIDREGNIILNHRQKHLYQTDQTWAQEGPQFNKINLQTVAGIEFTATVAICMDINPWEFKDNSQFELADYCLENQVDVIIFLSAWNDHEPGNTSQAGIDGMIDYWIYRLYTIVNKQGKKKEEFYKNFLFLCSDRVGVDISLDQQQEQKVHYIGCSCALTLNPFQQIYVLPQQAEGFILAQAFLNK